MILTDLAPELDVLQGTTWHDGKLYRFQPQFIEVLRIWPEPAAWRKTASGGWQHVLSGSFCYDWHVERAQAVRTALAMAAPGCEPPPDPLTVPQVLGNPRVRRRVPDWRVCEAIPPRVGACLSGLGGRAWHLLTLVARVPAAIELAESNRAVAWILASSRNFRPCTQPMRRARRLVQMPRHALLGELGWPARRAVVRLLAKVTPDALSRVTELLGLRDRCHDENFLREAGHLPVVTRDVLRLMVDARIARCATPALWREVAALPGEKARGQVEPPVAHMLGQTIEMATDLGMVLPPVTGLAHLQRLGADLHAGLDRLAEERGLTRLRFGPPPLLPPAALTMVPLQSFATLRQEGERMHHCIGSPAQRYVHAIHAGTAYAWHVEHPEATVFVERVAGRWVVAEVRGFRNAPVPGWLTARLARWVAEAGAAGGGGRAVEVAEDAVSAA